MTLCSIYSTFKNQVNKWTVYRYFRDI